MQPIVCTNVTSSGGMPPPSDSVLAMRQLRSDAAKRDEAYTAWGSSWARLSFGIQGPASDPVN